jgi:hypothetical protein
MEAAADADVDLSITKEFDAGQVLRLSAPSLDSKEGITFAGSSVSSDGKWQPRSSEFLHGSRSHHTIRVPAGSAAVLKLQLAS